MPVLKIWGWGKRFLVEKLDVSIAKKFAESGLISESENEEFEGESDGYALGFDPSAIIFIDDKEICTVEELISFGVDCEKYDELENATVGKEISEVKNAWVKEETYKGVFAEVTIKDYDLKEGVPSKEFIADFMNNLQESTGRLFYLPEWNGEEVDDDDLSGKSGEYFILLNGERYELNVAGE